jgi:hypothetical protein
MRHAFLVLFMFLPFTTVLHGCGSDEPKGQGWVGRTFLLDTPAVSNFRWKKPVGMGPTFINYAPQFLFSVAAGTDDVLTVTLATAQEYVQDPCTPTLQATLRRAEYPNSTLSVPAFPMHIVSRDPTRPGQMTVTLHDVVFTDILPGLPSTTSARIAAILDFDESVCSTMGEGGIPCEVCPWNGERLCQTLEVDEVVTEEAATPIVPITAGEVTAACS